MYSETNIESEPEYLQRPKMSLIDYVLLTASLIILANAVWIHWFFEFTPQHVRG